MSTVTNITKVLQGKGVQTKVLLVDKRIKINNQLLNLMISLGK
jgi:hypothetical protein